MAGMLQFQIIFNPISAAELAKMPRELQLHILGEFRGLPQEALKSDFQHFGRWSGMGRRCIASGWGITGCISSGMNWGLWCIGF